MLTKKEKKISGTKYLNKKLSTILYLSAILWFLIYNFTLIYLLFISKEDGGEFMSGFSIFIRILIGVGVPFIVFLLAKVLSKKKQKKEGERK